LNDLAICVKYYLSSRKCRCAAKGGNFGNFGVLGGILIFIRFG
jgi:hypothetical protein